MRIVVFHTMGRVPKRGWDGRWHYWRSRVFFFVNQQFIAVLDSRLRNLVLPKGAWHYGEGLRCREGKPSTYQTKGAALSKPIVWNFVKGHQREKMSLSGGLWGTGGDCHHYILGQSGDYGTRTGKNKGASEAQGITDTISVEQDIDKHYTESQLL